MKNAVAFFMSFGQWMQKHVRNMATDLQDTALLVGHPVKYLSRRGLVQNLGVGVGMIVQKHGHPVRTTRPVASQPSLLGKCSCKSIKGCSTTCKQLDLYCTL